MLSIESGTSREKYEYTVTKTLFIFKTHPQRTHNVTSETNSPAGIRKVVAFGPHCPKKELPKYIATSHPDDK